MLDADTLALVMAELKNKTGKETLDFNGDIIPYLLENQAEIANKINNIRELRTSLIKGEIKKKLTEIEVLVKRM